MTGRRWCEIDWDTCPARSTLTSPPCRAAVSIYTSTPEGWGTEGDRWRCVRSHHGWVDVIDDAYFEGEELAYLDGPTLDRYGLPDLAGAVEVAALAQLGDLDDAPPEEDACRSA